MLIHDGQMPRVRLSDLRDELLPEATYTMRVHEARYVPVPKNGTNPYIAAKLMVTGPDETYLGRVIFATYPLSGGGKYRIIELLTVTGKPEDYELEGPDQLVGLEFKALVGVQKGDGTWPDKNVVLRHLPI
jgi:hypothetical protein